MLEYYSNISHCDWLVYIYKLSGANSTERQRLYNERTDVPEVVTTTTTAYPSYQHLCLQERTCYVHYGPVIYHCVKAGNYLKRARNVTLSSHHVGSCPNRTIAHSADLLLQAQ